MSNHTVQLSKSVVSINKKLFKELKTLEPQGASDRLFMISANSYEKAVDEIYSMQYRYDQERLKLKKELNSPIKLIGGRTFTDEILPEHKKLSFSRSSPTKPVKKQDLDTSNSTLNTRLNQIMTNCKILAQDNKLALKLFPKFAQNATEKFENLTDVLDFITMKPGNRIVKYEKIRQIAQSSKKSPLIPRKPPLIHKYRNHSPIAFLKKLNS